jgi:23S rRNA (uracil1939-C5)-methyltransferase
VGAPVEVEVAAIVAGGWGLAHHADGRVVMVDGGLPGEAVRATVTESHAGYARARVVDVVRPSPARVAPPCPHLARGCGGCPWQHVRPEAQGALKAAIVTDSLRRLARLDRPPVRLGPALPAWSYRTTLRLVVDGGRLGFRAARSHRVVVVDECLVAHPLLDQLLAEARFGPPAQRVTLRCGARTGERMAVVEPGRRGVDLPPDVAVAGGSDRAGRGAASIHEVVAGCRFRVSAGSFFQASPEGADLLVDLVGQALGDAPAGDLVDAYGGVGLFAATAGAGRPATLLEASPSAVADARHNLAGVRVVHVDVARWRPRPAAAVVADPPRAGLGRAAADVLAATGATHLALVSCDAASLGRDAGLLAGYGYRLEWAASLDLFPGTPHVEVVSRFVR